MRGAYWYWIFFFYKVSFMKHPIVHPHGPTPISPVTLSLLHLLLFIHYLSPLPLSQNQIFTSCSDIHKDRKRTRPPEPSHLVWKWQQHSVAQKDQAVFDKQVKLIFLLRIFGIKCCSFSQHLSKHYDELHYDLHHELHHKVRHYSVFSYTCAMHNVRCKMYNQHSEYW